MCVSDPCAFGALTYCLERGWAVPQRVAIAGFGAFEISACCVPSISTLAVNGEEMGEKAATLILELIDPLAAKIKKIGPRFLEVAAKPMLRASTVSKM